MNLLQLTIFCASIITTYIICYIIYEFCKKRAWRNYLRNHPELLKWKKATKAEVMIGNLTSVDCFYEAEEKLRAILREVKLK